MDPLSPAARRTLAWLREAVIGLNLCPFAKAPCAKGQVHIAVCESDDPRELLLALDAELLALVAADPAQRETTLLVHPHALLDFDDFNDFLGAAEALLTERDLDGVIQLASFHPAYQFAGSAPDDVANATNRSPHPTLHLLREASIDRAVAAFPEPETIFEANIATLERLGQAGWDVLAERWQADAR